MDNSPLCGPKDIAKNAKHCSSRHPRTNPGRKPVLQARYDHALGTHRVRAALRSGRGAFHLTLSLALR